MKKIRTYIQEKWWLSFLINFAIIFCVSIGMDMFSSNSDNRTLMGEVGYAVTMAIFFTFLNRHLLPFDIAKGDEYPDNTYFFAAGQRAPLKEYLLSNGYDIDRNEGNITYFHLSKNKKFDNTFIKETDHMTVVYSSTEVLKDLPDSIAPLKLRHA